MCYSVSSKLSGIQIKELENDFSTELEEKEVPEFYVASGFSHPKLPVITAERKFRNYNWGLIPHWINDWEAAKVSRKRCLNSIGEEAVSKPSYRDAIKNGQFCIIPVNGFFEWHHFNDEKYPHFIYPKDKFVFLLAGLYNQWTDRTTCEVHDTFTIMTTRANDRMEWIHNTKKRMPVILNVNDSKAWLDTGVSYEQKKQLLEPYDSSLMSDHSISKYITNRDENPNTPKVMEPFEYPELALS